MATEVSGRVMGKDDSLWIDSASISAATELAAVCQKIMARGWNELRWKEAESCDEFQSEHLCGGFDSDEVAFCFSLFSDNRAEKWFQFTLEEASRIAIGSPVRLLLREPS